MLYRRFGRTELRMPVFTCGAMRHQQSWNWFPGNKAGNLKGLDFSRALKDSPFAAQIPASLAEAHALLSGEEVKRLGKH